MLTSLLLSLTVLARQRPQRPAGKPPTPTEIARTIASFGKEFTFPKIHGEGDYLDRLGRALVRMAACPEGTARRGCEALDAMERRLASPPSGFQTAALQYPYGFENGVICRLWFLLRHRPDPRRGVLTDRDYWAYHGDIAPLGGHDVPIPGYDFPWTLEEGRWRLVPFDIRSDPGSQGSPLSIYDAFRKLPLRRLSGAAGRRSAQVQEAGTDLTLAFDMTTLVWDGNDYLQERN